MRILQLCNKPPLPAIDGGCLAMHAITTGLLQKGHSVKVMALHTHKHPYLEDEFPAKYLHQTQFEAVYVETEINWVDAFSCLITRDSYNLNRFFTPDMDIALTRHLKNYEYDIIQLESLFMAPYITTIRQYSNAKIILRAHNLEYHLWERRAFNSKGLAKRHYQKYLARELKKYEKHYMNLVDGIAAISEIDRDDIQKLGVDKPVVTIPFGIDVQEDEKPLNEKEENSVFHLGAMDWDPNLEGVQWFCEEVVPDLKSAHPDVNFYVAGKRSERLREIKSFKSATVVGEVDSAKDFMNSKDIMVVPLKSAGGMRVKIIEGMAHGKPIVTTSIGKEGIDIENRKHLLVANNKEEFLDAITELRTRPDFKNDIIANAKRLIREKYDNQVIIKKLELFYDSLIQE